MLRKSCAASFYQVSPIQFFLQPVDLFVECLHLVG